VDPAAVLAYAALLDRVLEDRQISDEEVVALARMASEWELSRAAIATIHRAYFDGLVGVALADGVVTAEERADLAHIAALLGEPAAARSLEPPGSGLALRVDRRKEFQGATVCFTGESLAR
jgi:DNA polymerase-3 subunit epsilon